MKNNNNELNIIEIIKELLGFVRGTRTRYGIALEEKRKKGQKLKKI